MITIPLATCRRKNYRHRARNDDRRRRTQAVSLVRTLLFPPHQWRSRTEILLGEVSQGISRGGANMGNDGGRRRSPLRRRTQGRCINVHVACSAMNAIPALPLPASIVSRVSAPFTGKSGETAKRRANRPHGRRRREDSPDRAQVSAVYSLLSTSASEQKADLAPLGAGCLLLAMSGLSAWCDSTCKN